MTAESVPHLGIVTGETAPQLTADGQALQSVLRDRGYATEPVVWTEPHVSWSTFDAVVVRSCWQYYRRPTAFENWLTTLENAGVRILNPGHVIRWNMHKFYLRELESAGVPMPTTSWVERGSDTDLDALLEHRGWEEAVVKPAIGTSSDGVWRVSRPVTPPEQERFETAMRETDQLVQQFVPEIHDGELSFVFFAGEYSHANRSIPASDDFRAHPNFDGTTSRTTPSSELVTAAESIVQRAANVCSVDSESLVYARVDGIERDGRFQLLELELIEPYLGLTRGESTTEQFADAIERFLEATAPSRSQMNA